ncbi:adenylate/guanylate cyclase domain-containing protein [Rubrivirga litoralis]|uniref:Adenylate/guanylate cyclase domain-containing protein n=1 Tax=Rubrivirga litoralis TaxID=3075598 RepID=A0ABU3BRY3_9BACT|nr:adenylate/guanylate cyclase domain-containing protein [Rubrivirga sp. F394]MDT0631941.1 adenylate/guanylate cyclase domain-containing protein [Rubrivirga sp. F394]
MRLRTRPLQAATALVSGWVAATLLLSLVSAPADQPANLGLSLVLGVAMGANSVWFELSFLPRYGRRLTALAVIAARTAFYTVAGAVSLVALVAWATHDRLGIGPLAALGVPEVQAFFVGPRFIGGLAGLTLTSFAINFVRQVRLVLGPGTLWALLVGRYRLPVAEERAFMFLDLTGSTGAAQRLGPARFNDFKNDFFRDVARPILATGGQIYQYVGDEVVVTWRVRDGRLPRSPVETFLLLDRAIDRNADRYRQRYGEVPVYKAGVHCGAVATAEVGELKKDIVHSGDAVNVTARIEGRCHALGARLLVSEAALGLAPLPDDAEAEPVGEIDLRGRDGAVRLLRVTAGSADAPRTPADPSDEAPTVAA